MSLLPPHVWVRVSEMTFFRLYFFSRRLYRHLFVCTHHYFWIIFKIKLGGWLYAVPIMKVENWVIRLVFREHSFVLTFSRFTDCSKKNGFWFCRGSTMEVGIKFFGRFEVKGLQKNYFYGFIYIYTHFFVPRGLEGVIDQSSWNFSMLQ